MAWPQLAVRHHQRQQQSVPVAGDDMAEPGARQHSPQLLCGLAAHIMHTVVMRRQQPCICRHVNHQPPARTEHSSELRERCGRVHRTVAQQIRSHCPFETPVLKRQLVDAAPDDGAPRFRRGAQAGCLGPFEADQREFRPPAPIELPLDWMARKLGRGVDPAEVRDILHRLQFGVTEPRPGVFSVTVPSWRATKDVSIKDDLVEEVGRIADGVVVGSAIVRCMERHEKSEKLAEELEVFTSWLSEPLRRGR